jgi:dihydroneopterin aldolase
MRAADQSAPLVVKFGGSLCASAARLPWISVLCALPSRVVIVPGGGPFADAVRLAQPGIGFDDATGHAMAVLAMEQYALALAALHGLALAGTPEEMAMAHEAGRPALWRPAAMVAGARDIEPAWRVTSDSLSAWLARRLDAQALLLIKSVDVDAGATLADLVDAEVVDSAFPAYVGETPVFVAGPRALSEISDPRGTTRDAGSVPGVAIDTAHRKRAS